MKFSSPEVKKFGQPKVLGVRSMSHPLYGLQFPKTIKAPPQGTNDLPQKDVAPLCPPYTSIWRENKRGGWAVHYTCDKFWHKRHSEPWSRHGNDSHAAMLACLRHAWGLFLSDHKLPVSHCPIAGLMVP